MSKSKNNVMKAAPKMREAVLKYYEDDDFPGPKIVTCVALYHLSAAIKYSRQLDTLSPMQLVYFGSSAGDEQTTKVLLQLAFIKSWIVRDRPAMKIMRPYYKTFSDELTDFLKSKVPLDVAKEHLEKAAKDKNLYRQAVRRFKCCMEHPSLMEVEFIKRLPFNMDWLGARFCHLVNHYRTDLDQEVTNLLLIHPGYIGHLAEISDEYLPETC